MANDIPTHRYLTFFGPIRPPATTSFRLALCQFVNEGATEATILFASDGGSTHDGIALYAYLAAQPLKITMHAIGIVQSMAIPVFLAADNRLASQHARFLFHEYTWTHGQASVITKSTMDEHSILLGNALDWSKSIIKARTKLTDSDFESMKLFDHPHLMDAATASTHGLVSAVAEPCVPTGSQPRVVV